MASDVGFIALTDVAAEFGGIMLPYLKHAWEARLARGKDGKADLPEAILKFHLYLHVHHVLISRHQLVTHLHGGLE